MKKALLFKCTSDVNKWRGEEVKKRLGNLYERIDRFVSVVFVKLEALSDFIH